MAQNTLTQNMETAAEVIKEVKEAIIEKGVEILKGTHATEYPGYIAQMTSKTEFEELEERVTANKSSIEEINNITVWRQELSGNITGNLSEVGTIEFSEDKIYNIGSYATRPANVLARTSVKAGDINTVGDGRTGVGLTYDAIVAIQCSEEDTTPLTYPKVLFYSKGAREASSSIREAVPGTLSIPEKLCIGNKQEAEQENTLHIEGTSSQTGHAYHYNTILTGVNKKSYNDGIRGTALTPNRELHLTGSASGSSYISFFNKNSTKATSYLIE
ncbi:MAG: hypothetical protein LUD15_08575 [Bacteroides sp.]|nr:hypothetical protein [Bacteroides sp.]